MRINDRFQSDGYGRRTSNEVEKRIASDGNAGFFELFLLIPHATNND